MSSRGGIGRLTSSDNCNSNVEKMSLTSSTLKRNPKMELSRSDLLRLLSILEGELQAREIVIAVLKAEQIKKLLYPNKCTPKTTFSSKTIKLNSNGNESSNVLTYSDPWNALSRDAFGAYDPSFDKTTTIALFNMKMSQLEALIVQQRKARNNLRDQLKITETKYNKIVEELEHEKRLKEDVRPDNEDSADGVVDGVVDSVNKKLENDFKKMSQTLELEKCREKQIVLCLLSERKQLIIKLIEERQRNEELLQLLSSEKGKIAEMVEGLEDESKRSLQMEAELEKYLSDFEGERERFRNQLSASETRNAELAAEVDRLREELHKNEKGVNLVNLGEGVRSAIVTMSSSTRVVPTVPSVSTVSHPRASLAQAISPKPLTNANSAQPQSTAKSAANAKNVVSTQGQQNSYATVQPISSVKMNATIPPPPSMPAPPPKALISSKPAVSPHSQQTVAVTVNPNAFQNMTYNIESITPTIATTQSNHSTNNNIILTKATTIATTTTTTTIATTTATTTANTVTTTAAKVKAQVSQTATTQSTQLQSSQLPIQRKLSASGVGRGTPPPIPPNKPIIKPVLPPHALQQRSKDVNSTKLMSGSVATPAKIVSGTIGSMNTSTNANTPSNNMKNSTTIAANDSTGEQNSCQQINDIQNENSNNSDGNTNVDLLCQELENFNSLLVSMVSTGSNKSS